MSYARNGAIICDSCGLFCRPYDEETPFGCRNPENPEPYDPYHYCKKCYPKQYRGWVKKFRAGVRYGHWQKSRAEVQAAKKCGLVWVHGLMGDCLSGNRERYATYEYVTTEKYAHIKALDYEEK